VETVDQVAFLEERNCDNYQGYYFAHPLHPDEFERLLSKGKVD
jgi:EAL domain-containing protein (putative c-di-GMP-specific phosphodiesterase class I)